MATSSKCMWFAFAVIFAVVAATLQPSAATSRVVLDDADQEAGPSPRPPAWRPRPRLIPPLPCIPGLPRLPWLPPCNNNDSSSSGGGGHAPIVVPHPPLPPLPCIPGLPRLPWLPPCNNDSSPSSGSGGGAPAIDPTPAPPQPAECRTSLSGLAPCADFLTNATSGGSASPAAACCAGLKSLVEDAPICLCHAMNGDLGKIMPAPVLRLRVMALPRTCHVAVPFGTLRKCIRGPVPPMDAPSAPPAA
ncbi:hypothetical protein BDA96_02G314300 [Sorghum bicolor]|uniref:Bifunctional inhibitor/plant lipid transfer protein/seed storage helical domain-containing protein n=2 Tax=Sorghum bicolor TaxID=4558 RepID=A0A921RSW1_SORBI|nr:wiskott-Aldrich syndrome protein homolog [Sorghum bicolor]EER97194.1 hypothetical protein SORBI_3002G298600 [Sorghum bicolor]KAG0544875.1 hypothetical protein BDA96_02G314300 [Sorghum bicolor]|eukprot:XP_002460673.1 wiskott-Aldrich syndrome protein homolog [Sorghum bicolor]